MEGERRKQCMYIVSCHHLIDEIKNDRIELQWLRCDAQKWKCRSRNGRMLDRETLRSVNEWRYLSMCLPFKKIQKYAISRRLSLKCQLPSNWVNYGCLADWPFHSARVAVDIAVSSSIGASRAVKESLSISGIFLHTEEMALGGCQASRNKRQFSGTGGATETERRPHGTRRPKTSPGVLLYMYYSK